MISVAAAMSTLSPEVLEMINAVGVSIAAALQRGGTASGATGRLEERHFRRIDKYDGSGHFSDWSFTFKAAMRSANKATTKVMEWVQGQSKLEMDELDKYLVDVTDVDPAGSELFDTLVNLTSGEALTVVRGSPDMNGFMAWRLLVERFNPNTPAKALAMMMEVMNPKKPTDPNNIPQAIDEWDLKVLSLEKGFQERLSDRMKIALMLAMIPGDLQDMMYQQAENMKSYPDARARLKGIIQNRIVRNSPVPMEVGKVGQEDSFRYADEVNYMTKGKGKARCHSCGLPGHFARECPKGKGKSTGKGYQGVCFNCGEFGHPARECPFWGKGGGKKGKGDSKGKGKNGGWFGKGVWQVEEQDDGTADWQWDAEDDEDAGEVGAIDREPDATGEEEWKTVARGRFRRRAVPKMAGGEMNSIDKVTAENEREVNEVHPGWEKIRVQVDSGAIDTVAPKHVANAFELRETAMSRNNVGFVAANGSRICNYGERKVLGYTDNGEGVSMRMTCADVKKVLGSVHRMNRGGNVVVMDGERSYMQNKKTGRKTRIHYENGQYVLYMWVPIKTNEAEETRGKVLAGNRFAILAADDEQDFIRQDTRSP